MNLGSPTWRAYMKTLETESVKELIAEIEKGKAYHSAVECLGQAANRVVN